MTKKNNNTRSVLIMGNEFKALSNFMTDNNEKLEFVYFEVDTHGDIVSCSVHTEAKSDIPHYRLSKKYQKKLGENEGYPAFWRTLADNKPSNIEYTKIEN